MSPTHYHIPDPRQPQTGATGCALVLGCLAAFTLVIWWGAAMAWHASAVRSVQATPAMTPATVTRK